MDGFEQEKGVQGEAEVKSRVTRSTVSDTAQQLSVTANLRSGTRITKATAIYTSSRKGTIRSQGSEKKIASTAARAESGKNLALRMAM